MLNQQYFFNNEDYVALKRRITLSSLPYITATEFITCSPLLPYSVLIGRTPSYKLVRKVKVEKRVMQPQPLPLIYEQLIPSPEPIAPVEFEIATSKPYVARYWQVPSPEPAEFLIPTSQTNTQIQSASNFEFFTHLKSPPSGKNLVIDQDLDQELFSSNANLIIGQNYQFIKPAPLQNYNEIKEPETKYEPERKEKTEKKKIFSNLLDNFVSGSERPLQSSSRQEGYFSKKYQSPQEQSTPKIKIEDYMVRKILR